MSDALFDEIVSQLRGKPIEYLCPYLMADPMSDRKIFDRIAALRRALPVTHIEVSTTGLYLHPRLTEQLLAAPLSELRISSHGISQDEWQATMPGLKHDKHWPNVLRFIEAWQRLKPYPLRIVTLKGMWSPEREADIRKHWAAQGIETVSWDVITRAKQVDLSIFGRTRSSHHAAHTPIRTRCRFGRDTHWLHLLSDGRAALCCMDYKQEAIVGSLSGPHAMTIEQLWRSEAFETLRAKVRGDLPTDAEFICHRCEWLVEDIDAGNSVERTYTDGALNVMTESSGVCR